MPEKKKIRNDILLVTIVLSVALIGFIIFKVTLKDGKYVTVSLDGTEKYRYNLNENREFTVNSGENGENINQIVIKDGYAFISKADCPDKICVNHRKISKAGETIVCLPHKAVVAIVSE